MPSQAAPPSGDIPITTGWVRASAVGASGGGAAAQATPQPTPIATQGLPVDWLRRSRRRTHGVRIHGISRTRHPVARPGGDAALPPRGGSGNGAFAVTSALVQGHTAALRNPPPPPSTPAIPFLPQVPTAAAGAGADVPVITRNGAASHLGRGGGGSGSGSGSASTDVVTGGGSATPPIKVAENPSSLPSSSIGNGSGFALSPFPYFPMYVLDENNGVVLFNNQYQLASLETNVDLYAQVKGTLVSTYSWTTSSNFDGNFETGASTYHFHFQWPPSQAIAATESVTLTVTNSSSQQESQTFYFEVPTGSMSAHRQRELANHASRPTR